MTGQKKRRLGVNIDHIATLREARREWYPDPCEALSVLQACDVDQVTIHLREDRRHIQDHDLTRIVEANVLPVNLELAVNEEMVNIAGRHKIHTATFVPEKREEITTEGGLDCVKYFNRVKASVKALQDRGIRCSLFIDPDCEQVQASAEIGAEAIEFHTGSYCQVLEEVYAEFGHYDYTRDKDLHHKTDVEISKLKEACAKSLNLGLLPFAGHGLHRDNLKPVIEIKEIEEYNIGHAIIARSVFVGLKTAIAEISEILKV